MSEGFIDGVYNYCDRWCERCPLTARCRVYAFEEEQKRTDDFNAAFWKMFEDFAYPLLEEMLTDEESGDERYLPQLDEWDRDEYKRDLRPFEDIRERNPAVRLADDYGMTVHDWIKQHTDLEAILSDRSHSKSASLDEIRREDALEIVSWYALQIGVKLARSLSGSDRLDEDTCYDEEDNDRDLAIADSTEETREAMIDVSKMERDGSAKVSLTGIERSLGAWTILRDHYPLHEETILGFQKTLARLRRHIDQHIPGARTFSRPGFEYEV